MQGKKYLVTTNNWFVAPDGNQYRSAWGEVEILQDDFLGIKTNRNSTNWFARIGVGNRHIIVAGYQIFYAVRCENIPFTGEPIEHNFHEGKTVKDIGCSKIYIAQGNDYKPEYTGGLVHSSKLFPIEGEEVVVPLTKLTQFLNTSLEENKPDDIT